MTAPRIRATPTAERSPETLAGKVVLCILYCAGVMDLLASALWVGPLIHLGLGPQQAGIIVSSYLFGVLCSSSMLAPWFHTVSPRAVTVIGFTLSASLFAVLTQVHAFVPLIALHLAAGLAAGLAIAGAQGTMGRSENPMRLFALAGLGFGVLAIVFFGVAPRLIAVHGAPAFFLVLCSVHAFGALTALIGFPHRPLSQAATRVLARPGWTRLVLLTFAAVACVGTTESMLISFAQRIGLTHGFSELRVGNVLVLGGILNLAAPILTATVGPLLSKRLVCLVCIPLHGLLAAMIVAVSGFAAFAVALDGMVWIFMIAIVFVSTVVANADPTGRTSASVPAMMVAGASIGPALGGVLAQAYGYASLGIAALILASIGIVAFLAMWRQSETFLRLTTSPAE